MALTITHSFVSSNGDPTDPTLIGQTKWNAEHTVVGAGTAAELDVDTDATLAADSDSKIATQKAVKAYVDALPHSGLTAVVDDTNPQLGGDLDLNSHVITGLEIGSDVQAYSANLDSWSLVAPGSYLTTSAAAAAYQPLDSDLTTWAGLTPSANAQSLVTALDYSAMRTLLSLVPGTDFYSKTAADAAFQPLDSDLTAIAALATTAAGLSVLTIADPNADRIMAWDDSAGSVVPIALADLTSDGAPTTGDYLLGYTAAGSLVKIAWSSLPSGGSGITAVVDDTTPQLGGNLDLNGHTITGLVIGTDVQAYSANLTEFSGDLSTNVQSSGRLGFDDTGGLYFYEAIGAAAAGYGVAIHTAGNFSYTGGTAGNVNSTLHAGTTVSAGVADFIWGTLSILNNNATAGENVAIYGQAFKNSTGATWAGVFEAEDTTDTANPTGGMTGVEIDIQGTGGDSHASRIGLDIVIFKRAGAACEVGTGIRIGPFGDDSANGSFIKGIDFRQTFNYGIDFLNAVCTLGAIRLGTDGAILMDDSSNVLFAYGALESMALIRENTSTGNANKNVLMLRHTADGTFAAGMGAGLAFSAETSSGNNETGAFISGTFSDVTATSEDCQLEFGTMLNGAAAATRLILTSTELKPATDDGLAIGSTAKKFSDIFLASGAVTNYAAGDFTTTHSTGLLTFSGKIAASNVLSGTYTPTMTGVTNIGAATGLVCQYTRVGDVVTVSGVVQIDPVSTGATVVGISLPIASNIGVLNNLGGVGQGTLTAETAAIYGDSTNDRAEMQFIATDTTSHNFAFTFTYRIL